MGDNLILGLIAAVATGSFLSGWMARHATGLGRQENAHYTDPGFWLDAARNALPMPGDWICPCGASNPPDFAVCWMCDEFQPEPAAPYDWAAEADLLTRALGIDPGGIWTGIVLRYGDRLADFTVLRRAAGETDREWIGRNLEAIEAVLRDEATEPIVAVESVVAPTGRLGIISLEGLLGAAAVYGAVLGEYDEAVTVRPGGHGSAPLVAYPIHLQGQGEKIGTGRLRHARSAWDIAGAGIFLAKVGAR